jgi:GNAT superfamily N-acetyltransferase
MNIIIREAQESDIPILLNLEQELVRAERPFDPTIRKDPVWYYDIPALLADSKSRFVVAENEGEIVACAFGTHKEPRQYLDHDKYAYFGLMVTREAHRGKGINKLLIDDLKAWARKNNLKEMRLTVYDDNFSAIKAYEKSGFKRHIVEMRFRENE